MRTLATLVLAASIAFPAWAQPGGGMHGESLPASVIVEASTDAMKTNVTTDITDIWWLESESGWGIQFVHNRNILFATLFVYGAGNVPTFLVAVLESTTFGGGTFTGPLYATTGSPYGAPWNPAAVSDAVVGTMTFQLTGIGTGNLSYNVGATNVSKVISRQTLRFEDNSGDYLLTDTYSGTGSGGCGTGAEQGTLNVVQSGASATLTIDWDGNLCTFPTTYSQTGRFGQYQGTMSCSNGTTGTANFFEVHNRVKMLTGRYSISNSLGCSYQGRFAAIAPTP